MVPLPYQILMFVIAVVLLYTPFKGVPVTGPVSVNPEMVVADRFVVPATFRFLVVTSFPLTFELVMVVAAKVEAPVTLRVPGVVNELKAVMLFVSCDSCVGCPVKLA